MIRAAIVGGSAAAKVSTTVGYEAGDRGIIIDVTTPFTWSLPRPSAMVNRS